MFDFTPFSRPLFAPRVRAARNWLGRTREVQMHQLQHLLSRCVSTAVGERCHAREIRTYDDFRRNFPVVSYEDIHNDIMRMVMGEKDILWPGRCKRFAQSSGTSDGKSKYIPVTDEALSRNHYAGGRDVVAHYLNLNPGSRIFSGKSFILGGSYANEVNHLPADVRVGDLSANLIDNINPLANLFRIPSKKVAFMVDWHEKLPALVNASLHENVTNISGVPSWFMTVLREVIKAAGADTIHDVWPGLEVFFHGGISFEPYRAQYMALTDPSKMHYLETYNASEGFFAVQSSLDTTAMLLLIDIGIFFEFVPLDGLDDPQNSALPAWQLEQGKTYALVISSCNGLWRYMIGDTVTVESLDPLKISIAGRTKHFINAFGEEVMVHNSDAAIAKACAKTGASVLNYTAAPVYDDGGHRGHHQWLIEWAERPADTEAFAEALDSALQSVNSDYQAKRSGNIFLDRLTIDEAPAGLFDHWLESTGKLGGQRKVPRLCNDRHIIEQMLALKDKQLSINNI